MKPPRVLVVDDDPGIRSVCRRFLVEEGFDAVEVGTGEDAVQALSGQSFDVVLSDIIIEGGMGGEELLREVRARCPQASVVLMTSFPTLETAIQALRDGASDYLLKPFTADALIHTVRRAWEIRRLTEELREEKDLRLELKAAYEELRRMERMKADFVGRVSHELRTPLATILSAMELLKRKPDSPEAGKWVDVLEKGFHRLKTAVNDLLAFADLENGRLRCRRRDTDVRPILAGIAAHLKPLWEERRLTVKLELPEDLKPAWADPELLELAFRHLFANAVVHNVPGGEIKAAVSQSGPETIVRFVSTTRNLPKEEIPNLFDSFYQVGSSLTREVGGMGLGLSIVRHAVRLHGGSINASLLPGDRVSFVLTIPRPAAA